MSTRVNIIYSFQDQKHQKYVDPDKYGYLDVVYDIYSSVLRHIPVGRTVRFSVKFVLSENREEMQIASDDDVLNMFCLHEQSLDEGDKPIHLSVDQVDVSDCCTIDYSINGYPSAFIGRNESKGKVRKEVDASVHLSTDVVGKQASNSGGQKVRIKKTMVSKGSKSFTSIDAREVTSGRPRTRAATSGDASISTGMVDLTQGSGKGTTSTSDTRVYSISEDEELSVDQVDVSDCCTIDYSIINGYPSAVIGRDESKGKVRKEVDAFVHLSTDVVGKQASNSGGQKVRIKKTMVSKGSKSFTFIDAREVTSGRPRTRAATRGDASTSTGMVDLTEGSGKGTTSTSDTRVYLISEDEELSVDDSSDEDWRQDKGEGTTNSDSESEREGNSVYGDEDDDGGSDSNDELSDYHSDDCYELCNRNYDIDEEAKVNFHVGLCFSNVDEFRAALMDYNIQEGTDILRLKNEKARVTAVWAFVGCKWRIHASSTSDGVTYIVKSYYPDHTCSRFPKNPNVSSTWMGSKLASWLRADPDMKIESMRAALNTKYGINPHKQQLYRARKKAKQETDGSFKTAYAQLSKYGELLREKNPGTVFKLESHERTDLSQPLVFKRLFICLDACKKGFLRGCRPFIGLNGCQLRGTYGGVFLFAISMDGNNGLFPLAFAVVESETKDNWSFFLYNLYSTIDTAIDGLPLTFMSDKQKGLSDAIVETFPDAFHRNCCRHLYSNFEAKFPGMQLRNDFWAACKATSAMQFQKVMDGMQIHSKEAHDWLLRNPIGMWARHAFDHRAKSDHITNNMTESFNQWIDHFRGKPLVTLVDSIKVKLMSRLHKRFDKGCSYKEKLTPRMKKKLELVKSDASFCMAISTGGNEFEVTEVNSKRFVVNLNNKTCDCGIWEYSGIPCKHAASALIFKRQNLEDYCDKYYTMEKYMQAYGEMIHSLPDLTLRRLPRRPHKNKKRELKEKGQSSKHRITKKGKQKNTRPNDSDISSQMQIGSQSSTTASSQISIQAKRRAQMATKCEREKKRVKEALGQ